MDRVSDNELYYRNLILMLLGRNAIIMRYLCGYCVEPRTAKNFYHLGCYKYFAEIEDAYKYAMTNPFNGE